MSLKWTNRGQKIKFCKSCNFFQNRASTDTTSRGFPNVIPSTKGIHPFSKVRCWTSSHTSPDTLPQMPLKRACRKAGPHAFGALESSS